MNDLVFIQNEQAITTSLKVAEYFGKRHNDVLRAIENAISTVRNFAQSEETFEKSSYIKSSEGYHSCRPKNSQKGKSE